MRANLLPSRCLEILSFISIIVAFLDFRGGINVLCIKFILFWYGVKRKTFKVEENCLNLRVLRSGWLACKCSFTHLR